MPRRVHLPQAGDAWSALPTRTPRPEGGALAVYGVGAHGFAARVAQAAVEAGADVRHVRFAVGEAGRIDGDQVVAPVDEAAAWADRLVEQHRGRALVVSGEAFPLLVKPTVAVWISAHESLLSLPKERRVLAREADLTLFAPREEAAVALGLRLART